MPTDKADIFTLAQYGDFETFFHKFVTKDINNKSEFGSGLLHYAVVGKKHEIALFLIQNNIDVNMQNADGQTALHHICIFPNIDVAKAMLDKGANINIRDRYGNNALWSAVFNCKGRYYDLVELFMQYHPDILTENNAGKSPLDFAIQRGNERLVTLLNNAISK